MKDFKWLNESSAVESDGKLTILATPQSDFFCGSGVVAGEGVTPMSLANAPYYYTQVSGDFVFKAKVSHDFKDTYDAAALMIYESDNVWAKACFELTDFNTHAVVSVVTNGASDDANGCNIDANQVWLQVTRVGDCFAFHYSTDGDNFYMMRFFTLPTGKTTKIGLVAQAPTGNGGNRHFENITLQPKTVKNIRMGE